VNLYIEPPPLAGGGVVFLCFEEARVGECGWVQKIML